MAWRRWVAPRLRCEGTAHQGRAVPDPPEPRSPVAEGGSLAEALATSVMVLDGGLSTELEAQGHDLTSALWSARLLADDPSALVAAHRAYASAGARVVTTASYQASLDGFAAAGLDRAEAARLITRSVGLVRQGIEAVADGRPRWVAGSVGPYGAALADGSEYRGDYGRSVTFLRSWHRPRLQLLAEAGADVLALETIPCLAEVEALVAEVAGLGVPCWLSLTCAGGRTRAGESPREAYAMVRDVSDIIAAGVNCTAPDEAGDLVRVAAKISGLPAVIYPNRGERWDAVTRRWRGPGAFAPEAVHRWVADGARLVGGCCRVGPTEIAALARIRLGW